MEFENRIQTKEGLRDWITLQKKVILFGNESLVITLLRYYILMNENDKIRGLSYLQTTSEHMIFDEFIVKPITDYLVREDSRIILLAQSWEECQVMKGLIEDWNEKQIWYVDYSLITELSWEDNVKLDFFCTGFLKCGADCLGDALRNNKKIYIPKEKELFYDRWKNKYLDAPERFREMCFLGVSKKKKWGCVNPNYFCKADFVYENFGNTPKIIFILRNPADAVYSYFKMRMRQSDDPIHQMYFKKYRKYSSKMFYEYMEDDIFSGKNQSFFYDIWIKEYLKFYNQEDIMILFFEEIIRKPEKVLKKVQKFIGVKPIKDLQFPYNQIEKKVSKNYLSAIINGRLHQKSLYYQESGTDRQRRRFEKIRNFIWKYTLIDNDEKISLEDKKILMEYFWDSIQGVEEIAEKSLKGIWYE